MTDFETLKTQKNPLWLSHNIKYGETLAEKNGHVAQLVLQFAKDINTLKAISYAFELQNIDSKKPSVEKTFVLQVESLQIIIQAIVYEKQYDLDFSDIIEEQEKHITHTTLLTHLAEVLLQR